MRLTWLAALAGLWALSYLCVRQYGKGPWGSLVQSARRIYRPGIALLLLGILLTLAGEQLDVLGITGLGIIAGLFGALVVYWNSGEESK